jgi:hypothetical protein
MSRTDPIAARLVAHRLVGEAFSDVAAVVDWFGAVQAQDYAGSLWALGLRSNATRADVEAAIAKGTIVRTWPMRGTLHFVTAKDARWITKMLAPRVIKRAGARHRSLGLDDDTFVRAEKILSRALEGGKSLTRPEAYRTLAAAKIAPDGQRGIHILANLSMRGVLCIGPHRSKQPTFLLCDEWLPKGRALEGDEALGELARRYFTSHGPATERDFSWWTGLNLGEARRAIDIAGKIAEPKPTRAKMAALLPPFDEYTVAYRDRSAIGLRDGIANLMSPIVIVDGKFAGTWKRSGDAAKVDVRETPLVRRAIERFHAFTAAPDNR